MLGPGAQEKMSFLAKAGWWDWRRRIVVAKKSSLVRLPVTDLTREGLWGACHGKQGIRKSLVYLALLLHLEHARQYIFT